VGGNNVFALRGFLLTHRFYALLWLIVLVPKLQLSPLYTNAETPSFRQGLPESRLQGCKSAGWYIALIKHVRNLQVTIHGLDFGILAEMTAILAWLDLCNDESRNLGTSRVSAPDVALSL